MSSDSNVNRLQKLQVKCMRQILNVNRSVSCNTLFEQQHFMTVKQLIIFKSMLFIFKIVNGQAPLYLTSKIKSRNETHGRNLRSGNQFEASNAIKSCSQNSLFYKDLRLFNGLPNEIREATNFAKFQHY